MSECASNEEFDDKWERNSTISGSGSEATVHSPCPFCAEPDFLVHRVVDTSAAYSAGAVCKHCRRGVRRVVNAGPIGWTQEFVQTCGPDAPSWQRPIRREA
jgi:hypothetical protein